MFNKGDKVWIKTSCQVTAAGWWGTSYIGYFEDQDDNFITIRLTEATEPPSLTKVPIHHIIEFSNYDSGFKVTG